MKAIYPEQLFKTVNVIKCNNDINIKESILNRKEKIDTKIYFYF